MALPTQEARSRLQHEAGIYNGFPSYMCEEYCGYHLLTRMMQSPVPSVRVVPNFYGYYVPVKKTKSLEREQGGKERILWPWEGRSPILLTEDCGWPVHVHKLDVDERYVCLMVSLCTLSRYELIFGAARSFTPFLHVSMLSPTYTILYNVSEHLIPKPKTMNLKTLLCLVL